jgi:hypothetical protein
MKNLLIIVSLFFVTMLNAQTTVVEHGSLDGQKVILINFNKEVSSDFALEEIKKLNLQPTIFDDLQRLYLCSMIKN